MSLALGLAGFVAIDDIDFFHVPDLTDATAPHHEPIFAVLFLSGLLLLIGPTRPPGRLGVQRGFRGL